VIDADAGLIVTNDHVIRRAERITGRHVQHQTESAVKAGPVFPTSPADFRKLIADEAEKWGKVVRTAGIKA
jgi:S1-C subfamily serine protease